MSRRHQFLVIHVRKDNDDFKQNMTKLITILKGVLERQNNLSEFRKNKCYMPECFYRLYFEREHTQFNSSRKSAVFPSKNNNCNKTQEVIKI